MSGISGSRDAVRKAMIRSRNLTSHTYNPELAHAIAALIEQRYRPALLDLQVLLRERAQRR